MSYVWPMSGLESSPHPLPDDMSGILSLPDEVLKLVMRHVPHKDRLRRCCLVCKRLHAAAMAATDTMLLSFGVFRPNQRPTEDAPYALQWLANYGQHLTRLFCGGLPHTLQQLPCPNLLQLELSSGCCAQLGPAADGTPGVLQGCTKLTTLILERCRLPGTPEGFGKGQVEVVVDGLSSLVHLQHLRVQFGYGIRRFALPADTLPRLQHLSYLKVDNMALDNLLQLGSLPSLETLCLGGRDATITPDSLQDLALPDSLKTLAFSWDFDAAAVLPAAPKGLQRLSMPGGFVGPGSLLACLAPMTNLTLLDVGGQDTVWPDPGPAYSALTASSHLVSLSITHTDPPGGIWRHVFPADHKLPHLTFLSIDDQPKASDVIGPTPQAAWGAAELPSLVSCCPNLVMLHAMSLLPGPHVSVLSQLTGLTFLRVWYGMPNGPEDDEAFDAGAWPPAVPSQLTLLKASLQGLGSITQLQNLNVACCETLDKSLLLPLTSLTALSAVSWRGCGPRWYADPDRQMEDYEMELYTLQKRPAAPDVWLQLLEHCLPDPNRMPADPSCLSADPAAKQPPALSSLAALLTGDRAEAVQAALLSYQQERLVQIGDLVGELVDRFELNVRWRQGHLDRMAEQGMQIEPLKEAFQSVYEQLQELLKLYPEGDGSDEESSFGVGYDGDSEGDSD